jgi:hypothetical protein
MNLSAASEILKVQYLPPVREVLNNSTILLSGIEKDTTATDVSGKNFTIELHYGRNSSAGLGVGDDAVLPAAGRQFHKTAVIPMKYLYGKVQVTGPTIKATKSNAGAFVKAIENEMKGLMKDVRKSFNRQLHGTGTDTLAVTSGAAVTGTGAVDCSDGRGNAMVHIPQGSGLAIAVDILNASTGASRLSVGASGYPTAYAAAAGTSTTSVTFTFPSGTTISGGTTSDIVVPAFQAFDGTWASTRTNQMMGIAGIIAATDPVLPSGGLHGLDVSTYPWWAAQTVGSDSSKVDLSFARMQQVFSKIAIESDASEQDVKFLLCNYGVRDKYVELCIAERRIYNEMELDGGFEAVTFNGKPIVPDSQCLRSRLYYVVPDTLSLFRLSDFEWMEEDGSVWNRVSGKDAYEATLTHYGDLACKGSRNQNGVLLGINE